MSDFQLDTWRKANRARRLEATERLAGTLGSEYAMASASPSDDLPAFRHEPTGTVLRVVPGATFTMGLTDADTDGLAAATAEAGFDASVVAEFIARAAFMKPTREVTVPPLLLAERPFTNAMAAVLLEEEPPEEWGDLSRQMDADDVKRVVAALGRMGMRLPSEAEWELASRAGRSVRFASGNAVPKSPGIGPNPWGFVNCGADAEVCADGWWPSYEGAPKDGSARRAAGHPHACRGGAATVWPWQNTGEWLMMLCAYRQSAEDVDGFLTIRAARSLP